jgi:hypothetical protein
MECCIASNANPLHLILALKMLRAYTTEIELAGLFGLSEKTVRKWSSIYHENPPAQGQKGMKDLCHIGNKLIGS